MPRIVEARPSPAVLVAIAGLVLALGGSAVAVPDAVTRAITKSKVKTISARQANKVLDERAGTLNVNSAQTADSAQTAQSAQSAQTANSAQTAQTVADGAITTAKFGAIPAARVTRSTSQTLTGGNNPISFDVERFDIGGLHSNANPTALTAPVTGIYTITASISYSTACTSDCFIGIFRNAEAFIAADTGPTSASDEMSVATIAKLNAGDSAGVIVRGNGTQIEAVPEFSPEFSMVWSAPG